MQVEAQQIIPVRVEMSEKEAIIAILKNRNWYSENIIIEDNKMINKKRNYVISEDDDEIALYTNLINVLDILEKEENDVII